MGWLIALLCLVLLAILPLGVKLDYDEEGLRLDGKIGLLRIPILPAGKKKASASKQAGEPSPKAGKKESSPRQTGAKEKGGSVKDFLPLCRVGLQLLNGFRRKLRLEQLLLKIVLAEDDPCKLAVTYGRAWAAVGNLMPQLERFLVIKKRNIEIECDFTAPETLITARLVGTITLGRLLGLLVVYGLRGFKAYRIMSKKRKGGATT